MIVNYGLAGHPRASPACPAVSQEPALAPVLCLSCNLCLEAVFGRDAIAVPSYSDIPPPDNESNIPLTGSCKGEKSILQLLIKSKHPYFQQQAVGLLYWEIYYPFFYKADRGLFCTDFAVSSICFAHLGWYYLSPVMMITVILALLFIFARALWEVNFSPCVVGCTGYGAERHPVFFCGFQKVTVNTTHWSEKQQLMGKHIAALIIKSKTRNQEIPQNLLLIFQVSYPQRSIGFWVMSVASFPAKKNCLSQWQLSGRTTGRDSP